MSGRADGAAGEGGTPPAGAADQGGAGQGGDLPVRSIGRSDLEAVIRRAAELSVRAADAEERLSEADLLRIGEDVGLPAHHVLQALHERPELAADPSVFDGLFGSSVVVAHRALPADADALRTRLQTYLTTQEYLRVMRSKEGSVLLMPADDAISSVARVFTRPAKRHYLARARRVALATRPGTDGSAYIRLEADLAEQRKGYVTTGVVVGSGLGLAAGGVGAALVAAFADPGLAAAAGIIASLGSGLTAGLTTGVVVAARTFKGRVREARMELEGLLDRVEHGQRLEPPPAPWRQRLSRSFKRDA